MNRRLDLGRRVQGHGYSASRCRGDDNTGDLRGADDRGDVRRCEHAFQGEHIGLMQIQPFVDGVGDLQEPGIERSARRGAGDGDVHQRNLPVCSDVDHGKTATGQAGIDANNT